MNSPQSTVKELGVEQASAPDMQFDTLPIELDQVDAAWLTKALSVRYPGVRVSAVTMPRIHWGTATKVSLALDYSAVPTGADLPRAMVLKGGFDAAMRRRVWAAYRAEALFYGHLGKEVPIALPRTYFEGIDRTNQQALVLMEDLGASRCRFGSALEPMSIDQMRSALSSLASLHARWWNDDRLLADFEWKDALRIILRRWLREDYWSEQFEKNTNVVPSGALADREKVAGALEAMWQMQGPDRCIVHGDAHLGNIYFTPAGTPRLLDWQVIHAGSWAHDIAYLVVGALSVEDRRLAERELLAYYIDALSQYGVDAPKWDAAWLAYRRDIIHGYVSWFLTPSDMQLPEVLAAFAQRYHAAMVDHETMNLLGFS